MKIMINEMKLRLLAKGESEKLSRAMVTAAAYQFNPTVEELLDFCIAVSEAVTNCVVHAYVNLMPWEKGYIYITVRLYNNREISVEIRDTGVGIEDIERAKEPLYTTGDGERCGLGFVVMESCCDSLTVKSTVGRGTKVILRKKFTP